MHSPYKKIDHFNEHLSHIQANDTIEIPREVYIKIQLEIDDLDKVTTAEIKVIMKRLRFYKYYKNIPLIISKLTGKSPGKYSKEDKAK
jgi:hypothetical protein